MGNTPNFAFRYPESSDPVDIWEYIENLANDVDTYLAGVAAAVRSSWNALGPASALDITTATTVLTVTHAVTPGKQYMYDIAANGQSITTVGTLAVGVQAVTSGFAPPIVPSSAPPVGSLAGGSVHGLWAPGVGQASETFRITASKTAAAYRFAALSCSILLVDVTH